MDGVEYVSLLYVFQIDDNEDKSDNLTGACGGACVVPNALNYDQTLIPEEPDFFTAPYSGRKMDKYEQAKIIQIYVCQSIFIFSYIFRNTNQQNIYLRFIGNYPYMLMNKTNYIEVIKINILKNNAYI